MRTLNSGLLHASDKPSDHLLPVLEVGFRRAMRGRERTLMPPFIGAVALLIFIDNHTSRGGQDIVQQIDADHHRGAPSESPGSGLGGPRQDACVQASHREDQPAEHRSSPDRQRGSRTA